MPATPVQLRLFYPAPAPGTESGPEEMFITFFLSGRISERLALGGKVKLNDKKPVQQRQEPRILNAPAAFGMTEAAARTVSLLAVLSRSSLLSQMILNLV